ncbi:MAG: hypothetical protein Q8L24_01875 [bacterium]|nr:hypothetical protein [bacterium]
MSLAKGQSFAMALVAELREAGLPTDPRQVIGRMYQFECKNGSHHHVLFGMITAIEVSDEGGLQLYVSSPQFWGDRLISFMYVADGWRAYVDVKNPQRFYPGTLELL